MQEPLVLLFPKRRLPEDSISLKRWDAMPSEQAIIHSHPIFLTFVMRKDFLLSVKHLMSGSFQRRNGLQGWNVGTPGKQGYAEYFKEWAKTDLRDFILRDRNHPSVIMWSIGNEVDYPNDPIHSSDT